MIIKRNIIFNLEIRKSKGEKIITNLPIRMRVNYGGIRIDFPSGFRIDLDKWNKDLQRVEKNTSNKLEQTASEINEHLNKMSSVISSIFKEFEVKEVVPTPKDLKEYFNLKMNKENKNIHSDIFFKYFDDFITECSSQNNWANATIKKFNAIKSHLKNYDENINFQSLDEDKLLSYANHLRDKKDLRNSTIEKHIKNLKWFLRWATKKGYNKNNSFQEFKPKLKTTPKKVIFLSWEELKQMRDYKIPANKKILDSVRDVFLFQCYTGLRYSDVYNLRKSDLRDNQLEIMTIKTNDELIIEFNTYSREILNKYKNIELKDNKALPVMCIQKMNEYLKELGDLIGLNEPIREIYYKGNERIEEVLPKYMLLSSHAGRRTFICNSLALGIPVHTVMKWTGHNDYKAMKPYIDIADKDRKEAMKSWDNKEKNDTDKLLEQLKKIPKKELKTLFKGLIA